jgi:hypothetical protein
MTEKAREAYKQLVADIESKMKCLSDSDYVEVLEELSCQCDALVGAKRRLATLTEWGLDDPN